MLRVTLVFLTLALLSPVVQAGQVIMSCDFSKLYGIEDVQVKKTNLDLKIDVFMADESFNYYSLPLGPQQISSTIDLSEFNAFNGLDNARLVNTKGQWTFKANGISQPVSCATLK